MSTGLNICYLCESCGQINEYAADYFVSGEEILSEALIATCQFCHKDFIAELFQGYVA